MGARGPFGPLNDALNAAAAAMMSLLAFSLHRQRVGGGRGGVIAAILGGGVAVAGSALVLTGPTGWLLAGLVSAVGFALLGIWLALFSHSAARFPVGLRRLGVASGAVMSLGLILLPASAARVDNAESAPWWWAGFLGFLGTYVLYPFWVVWFGRILRRDTHHWH